jgi:aspartate kinase
VRAALAPIGAQVDVEADLGSVSVVGSGIGRHPDVAARALLALEHGGIDAQLVTSTPGRVAFHVPAPVVRAAVRLLHELFALSETRAAGADLAVRQAG